MNEKLKDAIKEYVVTLPEEAQSVINTFKWSEISNGIGERNGLKESELIDLETEVALVLVGLTQVSDFTRNVENKVGTTKEDAENIANEVLEKVFKVMSDKVTENIKNKLKDKKISWDQNVNFILSGGDYLSFLNRPSGTTDIPDQKTQPAPKNVTDLRDKFTI